MCRIFPGARLSARHRANALTKPYTRSAALSRTAPPSELACSLVERGDERLVEQIREQNTLWYRVRCHAGASVVAKRLYTLRLYHTEALVSLPESTPSRIIRANYAVRPPRLAPALPSEPSPRPHLIFPSQRGMTDTRPAPHRKPSHNDNK